MGASPLSGTFLQTLPDLVTPLKGHSLFLRSCPPTRSAPSEPTDTDKSIHVFRVINESDDIEISHKRRAIWLLNWSVSVFFLDCSCYLLSTDVYELPSYFSSTFSPFLMFRRQHL